VLVAFLAKSALAATYTETITAGCKNSQCSPALIIHGGVQWAFPATIDNICAGKPENSLVVLKNAQLAICITDVTSGQMTPFQLTETKTTPDYLLTTKTYSNKGGCHFWSTLSISKAKANVNLKNRLVQLEQLWDSFDVVCEEEYGSEFKAATPIDAMFAMKGTSAPLDRSLNVPILGNSGVYNVRGGYFFWYQANQVSFINDARWSLFPVYSDCYGGESSSKTTTLPLKVSGSTTLFTVCHNKQADAPDNPMKGLIKTNVNLPGYYGGQGPVLCRRRDINIQSITVPGVSQVKSNKGAQNPTCSSLFGSQFSMITPFDMAQYVTAPMSQGAYSSSLYAQFSIPSPYNDGLGFIPYNFDYQQSHLQIQLNNYDTCDYSTLKVTCSRGITPTLPP